MSMFKSRYFLWMVLALPALPMLAQFTSDTSRAEELLHISGEFSARMMIIAMIATPLRLLFSNKQWTFWLVKNRRYFGVAAFGYAFLHTVFYIIDMNSVRLILDELWDPGIWTGWVAFLIFIPLALTSNDTSQRAMGILWKQLQRFVYPAAVLTLAHWIFVHNNVGPALVHFVPLAALEIYRVYAQQKRSSSPFSTTHQES